MEEEPEQMPVGTGDGFAFEQEPSSEEEDTPRTSLADLLRGAEEPGSILYGLSHYEALEAFISENAPSFEGWSAEGEQRLEWTGMHARYVELVEMRIEEMLAEAGASSQEQFMMLASYLPSPNGGGGGAVLHKLMTMGDFSLFCKMMSDAVRHV